MKTGYIKAVNGDIIKKAYIGHHAPEIHDFAGVLEAIQKGNDRMVSIHPAQHSRVSDVVQTKSVAGGGIHLEQRDQMPDVVQKGNDRERLMEACRQLEAVFVNMVFERMRSTVKGDGLIKESFGEKMFTSMLDQELAGNACSGDGLGISTLLYRQLVKNLD